MASNGRTLGQRWDFRIVKILGGMQVWQVRKELTGEPRLCQRQIAHNWPIRGTRSWGRLANWGSEESASPQVRYEVHLENEMVGVRGWDRCEGRSS